MKNEVAGAALVAVAALVWAVAFFALVDPDGLREAMTLLVRPSLAWTSP